MKYQFCPFCSMPNEFKTVFDKATQSYAVECPDCFALGPRECTKDAAVKSFGMRKHDVEWRFKKGLKIAQRICSAVGQSDEKKIEALAIEIAEELNR